MAEVEQQPNAETHEPEAEAKEQRVPYERFEEVNQKLKRERAEREELTERLRQLEDRDKSEVERERGCWGAWLR